MASVVLAASNLASFFSSTWSDWASAPYDLHLITEDGIVGAHCGMLFPLSFYLAAVVEALPYTTGPTQVVLAETSSKALAAVRSLVYSGTCHLDELNLSKILDALSVLGIAVSSNSFSSKTEITDNEMPDLAIGGGGDVLNSVEGKVEGSTVSEAISNSQNNEICKEKSEGMITHNMESSLSKIHEANEDDMGKSDSKIRDLKVKIPKLNIVGKSLVYIKEKPNHCEQCLKNFSRKYRLEDHIKYVHNKEKPYQCDQCLNTYSCKNALRLHIKAVHIQERPYQCDQCLKKFSRKKTLSKHIEAVHDKEKPYQCNQCLKKFSRKNALSVHIKSVHKKEKPHQCDQCLEKFSSKIGLSLHIKTVHNKERSHQCDKCLKMFSRKFCLRLHIKTVHMNQKEHQCDRCLKKFSQKGALCQHIKTMHNEEKP